jgi:hypothetical protein
MRQYKKQIPAAFVSLALLALVWSSSSSCSSTTGPTNANDTIHLVSMQGNVNLTSLTTVDTVDLRLTCGCPFQLTNTGGTGDTTAFIVTYLAMDTSKVTPHRLLIKLNPNVAKHGAYGAGYVYSAVDHLGGTDYCSLLLTATLP